ncbi:hypothetical protein PENTCL1PPCAC_3612, partial [Pristionchus entomophagus]
FLYSNRWKMRRILGERNQNPTVSDQSASDLEEWKAVHEVNRAEIGNNGSFLEFGEEAVDCLEAEDEENAPILPAEAAAPAADVRVAANAAADIEQQFPAHLDLLSADSEGSAAAAENELENRSATVSQLSTAASHSFDDDESEVEIEFSAVASSTPLPSSPEIVIVTKPHPFISLEFSREKINLSIGTRALWRVVKWSVLPFLAIATYLYCPYVKYRVEKFIMEF